MPFDPTQHGFVRLRDFQIGGTVPVFEYGNDPSVDGSKDFLRLNLYLSMDRTYATIWWGLLEPLFAEAAFQEGGQLASVARLPELDFLSSYNEDLFRGHIDSEETAWHVLKALRVGQSSRYARPHVLRGGSDGKLRCDVTELIV